ncbi:MAG: hypothetical protein QOJ73_3827 [Streptosporangiaceae bacterium]|jgi:hypothetical protein|nr:hypothetical protein [Streptosporangiaceae bacterium]
MARAASQDIVILGSRRKAKLEAIVRRPSSPQALVRRAQIALLAHQRWANAQIATGQVVAEPIACNDPVTFTGFLHRLDQCIDPRLSIHLVMDNGSSHTSRADLAGKITSFAVRYNRTAHPCTWTYDARADHARHLACHARHPRSTAPGHRTTPAGNLPKAA